MRVKTINFRERRRQTQNKFATSLPCKLDCPRNALLLHQRQCLNNKEDNNNWSMDFMERHQLATISHHKEAQCNDHNTTCQAECLHPGRCHTCRDKFHTHRHPSFHQPRVQAQLQLRKMFTTSFCR